MTDKILAIIFILLASIISDVTANLTASELFNFEVVEYVPYIIVTTLLVIILSIFLIFKFRNTDPTCRSKDGTH
ncbi:25202_t:CDS:2 [Cetraspora pellucida]|uniref:25202_t:CDS:1 n=1 Tax=Cetraspora pellucida TaxID=1433469 RepID=A0A9N9C5H3_9GLOM|nr:25202_t:CDS:2 [Cetraspora pellucida]